MAAIWGDSDLSSSDEESLKAETVNICYMAFEDDDEVTTDQTEYSYEKLLNAFEEMHKAYKAVVQSNAHNKKRLSHTIEELVKVKCKNQNLTQERDELKN
ncbi:hypothetical protein DVA76_17525 [Acinetobacter baumannii]|nr:hypothetical protein DVA76_17525 [Acinetobacter baumannii]